MSNEIFDRDVVLLDGRTVRLSTLRTTLVENSPHHPDELVMQEVFDLLHQAGLHTLVPQKVTNQIGEACAKLVKLDARMTDLRRDAAGYAREQCLRAAAETKSEELARLIEDMKSQAIALTQQRDNAAQRAEESAKAAARAETLLRMDRAAGRTEMSGLYNLLSEVTAKLAHAHNQILELTEKLEGTKAPF